MSPLNEATMWEITVARNGNVAKRTRQQLAVDDAGVAAEEKEDDEHHINAANVRTDPDTSRPRHEPPSSRSEPFISPLQILGASPAAARGYRLADDSRAYVAQCASPREIPPLLVSRPGSSADVDMPREAGSTGWRPRLPLTCTEQAQSSVVRVGVCGCALSVIVVGVGLGMRMGNLVWGGDKRALLSAKRRLAAVNKMKLSLRRRLDVAVSDVHSVKREKRALEGKLAATKSVIGALTRGCR